jgi:hypothetical protein
VCTRKGRGQQEHQAPNGKPTPKAGWHRVWRGASADGGKEEPAPPNSTGSPSLTLKMASQAQTQRAGDGVTTGRLGGDDHRAPSARRAPPLPRKGPLGGTVREEGHRRAGEPPGKRDYT